MKKDNNKITKTFLLFILFLFAAPLFPQSVAPPWWLSLEYGKQRFRSGNYGAALMLFEDARRDRRAMYEKMERDFINLLSVGDVRRIGDSLERVEHYSRERHYTAATAALEELYYRVPKSSLRNSANAALEAIGKLKDYPEAEYWIGEVYRVEGELSLSLVQYRKAYAMREVLEDPGFSIELQYKISNLLRVRQEYNEMERTLHSIINEYDTLLSNARQAETSRAVNAASGRNNVSIPYAQASASFASQAMTRTLENEGIDRFLELYRYNNSTVEQAHRVLGFFYAATGRPTAQQHLMSAFLIQNTIIIEEIVRRDFDFPLTNRWITSSKLSVLAEEINRNPMLLSYVEEVEYYKTIYYLGASLFRNGRSSVARSLWEFLASVPQAGEWHSRALMQIRNPRMEPIVEMP